MNPNASTPASGGTLTPHESVAASIQGCEIQVPADGIRSSMVSGWWAKVSQGQALNLAQIGLAAVPDGWAKVNGEWVQIVAMHTLFADLNDCPTGYYARLDADQYEEIRRG